MLQSKISRRLLFSLLALAIGSVAFLGLYLLHFSYTENLTRQTADLNRNARIIEILLADELTAPIDSGPALTQKIHEISDTTQLRITLMDSSGKVLADSAEPAESLDNHLQRPEVQGALQHTPSSAIRYSSTLQENMLYAAVPVYNGNDQLLGIIRTASSTHPIDMAYAHTRSSILTALALTILAAIIAAWLLARRQLRPIQQMTADALRISHGELSHRLAIHTGDELEILAQTINQLTGSLAQKIHEVQSTAQQQMLILENMDNGVLLLDAQGNILTANRQAAHIFALLPEHMGKSSIHALGSAELSTRAKEISQAAAGTSLTMQLPVGGQRRTFSVFLAPFPEHQEQHVLCVFHDISLLQEMAARQSDFTANAAHELATPLTSISGFAETLLDDDFSAPEQSRKFIQTIYNEAQRMNRLLRDLLQLSRLDSQEYRRQLVIEPVDCCTLPPLLAQKLAPQLKSKELQFCQSLAKGPVFVEANRDLLLQVLANLTENAIKYTPKGGTITLSCLQEKEIVRLQVTDTGIGIPAKDLPFIFDRFYRADKARDRQTGGNGIGLSLVKFLVEIFGGTITVTSELQQGTTFTLEFPACP